LINNAVLKGLVIDLRPSTDIGEIFEYNLENALLSRGLDKLFRGSFYPPSLRTMMYRTSYYKYFQQEKLMTLYRGSGESDIPMVFIVNESSLLPGFVSGLQQSGKAAVMQIKSSGDITGTDYRFYITDSLLIRIRKSDSVNPDGTTGLFPTISYSPMESDSSILAKAALLIKNGYDYHPQPFQPPLFPKGRAIYYNKQNTYPTIGYRVLAAAEIYTVINHFFAYKDLMDKNWDDLYKTFLPLFVEAKDSLEYTKAVAEFYANIKDSHGAIFMSPLFPLITNGGKYFAPISGRMVEGKFIVDLIHNDSAAKANGIKRGDIILEINGRKPQDLIEEVRKFMPSSNLTAQTYFLSKELLKGEDGGSIQIKMMDSEKVIKSVNLLTLKVNENQGTGNILNEREHVPVLHFINKDIGYADLNRLKISEVDSMFDMFKDTKAIIFDMRGYPNGTYKAIAARLTDKKDIIAVRSRIQLHFRPRLNVLNDYVDSETWSNEYFIFQGGIGSTYKGKTVMLIDESAISQAEQTGLYFKAANGTIFVGSQTAGANGGAFYFSVPGNIGLNYTGQNISYPDGTQLQRVGLVPDIYITPTVKGIQSGRDEVLDRAVKYIELGK
jgi:C-terminal processing protease CtpA/Prc